MSGPQERPFSDNPNTPRVPYDLYSEEKANFAGIVIGWILCSTHGDPHLHVRPPALTSSVWLVLGVIVILLFQCVVAMLYPVHRRTGGNKWGLITYTVVMFSVVTVLTATGLDTQSISYIDDRELPGVEGVIPPGPLGYQSFIHSDLLSAVPNATFFLNNWLADSLLVSPLSDAAFTRPVSNTSSSSSTAAILYTPRTSGYRLPLPNVP